MKDDVRDKVVVGTLNNWVKEPLDHEICVVFGYLDRDKLGRFNEDEYIHTSATPNILMREGDVIETRNNKYVLGTRKPEVL